MRSTISLITTICYCFFAYPQINLHGAIKAKKSNKELSFVNIGIIGKDIGTVSNEKGEFYLSINENNLKDSIKISMIGYESKKNQSKNLESSLSNQKKFF